MPLLPERRNSTDFLAELTDWTDYKDDLLPYDEVGSAESADFSPQKALSPAARTALSKALAEEHDSPVHKENSAGELGGRPSPAARKAVRRALADAARENADGAFEPLTPPKSKRAPTTDVASWESAVQRYVAAEVAAVRKSKIKERKKPPAPFKF